MKNWQEHPYNWVIGSIDSNGAIHAEALVELKAHHGKMLNGKRWRWNIARQEFGSLAPRTVAEANNRIKLLTLNYEECFAVGDWLIRHGYADDNILSHGAEVD